MNPIVDVAVWMDTDTLGNRQQGRKVREALAARIERSAPMTLDFSHIEVMTSAFADECFGKLWDHFGPDRTKATIAIKGLAGNNRAIFRYVIANR